MAGMWGLFRVDQRAIETSVFTYCPQFRFGRFSKQMPDPPQETRVVVLGASNSPDRFSHKAVIQLVQTGYQTIPVNPNASEVAGVPCLSSIEDVDEAPDTVTIYLSAGRSSPLGNDLAALRPRRVIFNPGAENPELKHQLQNHGIECIEACTLVMLNTETF